MVFGSTAWPRRSRVPPENIGGHLCGLVTFSDSATRSNMPEGIHNAGLFCLCCHWTICALKKISPRRLPITEMWKSLSKAEVWVVPPTLYGASPTSFVDPLLFFAHFGKGNSMGDRCHDLPAHLGWRSRGIETGLAITAAFCIIQMSMSIL